MPARVVAILSIAVALFRTPEAGAQQEVCGEFAGWELEAMLDMADGEMTGLNMPAAWRTVAETRKELRCLDTLVEPAHLARLAHGRAFLTWLDQQDEETAATWVRLARSLHPEVLLPVEPPPRYREFYDGVPAAEMGEADGGLAKVKRGAVFMDGYVLPAPRAMVVTPHFVQLVDKKGRRIDAWWQDGVAFRDELLDDPGKDPPRWAVKMSPDREAPLMVEHEEPTVVAEATSEEEGWISEADEREWMPDCPWAGEEVKADAYGDTVVVNAQSWDVGSRSGETAFREVLGECHAHRALRRFERWRAARDRDVSVSSTGSRDLDVLVDLVGDAGTAVEAEVHRVGLIKALEDPDRRE